MKLYLVLILVLTFSFSVFGQDDLSDPGIAKLPLVKKRQITRLLVDVLKAKEIYLEFTDDIKITAATALIVKNVRNLAATLPKGTLKDHLTAGAGAWEKSFFFRFDSPSQIMLSMAKKSEIIKVYKLQDIPPEDRSAKLFDFAQAFFEIAADIAVASGVPTN